MRPRSSLGLELDDSSGKIVVTKPGPPCENVDSGGALWCRRGDEVHGSARLEPREDPRFSVIEELAIAIESVPPGEEIYVHFSRPASRGGTSLFVKIR
jgi:hypothetical protein